MKFTRQELGAILMLIEFKVEKLQEAKSLWVEFGDQAPDIIEEDLGFYLALRDKILEEMK